MKMRIIQGKWRRALKKVAFIGGNSISVAVVLFLITSCMNNHPLEPVSESNSIELTDQLIGEKCSSCHSLELVRNYQDTDWKDVVDNMIVYGVELTEDEAANIIAHLEDKKSF